MYIQNELKDIAKRLFEEKICLQPLAERDLTAIFSYMGMSDTGSDLMRRLSDIELNYEEIVREAEEASAEIKDTVIGCRDLLTSLIDGWNQRGLTNNYSFVVNKSVLSDMYQSFSKTAEALSARTAVLSKTTDLTAETAMQTKACSASFLEIHKETRLAYYAAALNKDKENMLSCRAIAYQAHDSSSESDKIAARFLSASRSGTAAIFAVNTLLSDLTVFFNNASFGKQINTAIAVNKVIACIGSLKNIASTIK